MLNGQKGQDRRTASGAALLRSFEWNRGAMDDLNLKEVLLSATYRAEGAIS